MALPTYDSLFQSEPLPAYLPTISFQGKLLCKREREEPCIPAFRRRWRRVEAELRGTTLILGILPWHALPDTRSPKRVRRYTLQYGDAGLALDYKHRLDAFRVRVEGEQLLFIAPERDQAVAWVETLLAAMAISEPLDQRKMPEYPRIPTRAAANAVKLNQTTTHDRQLWGQLFSYHAGQKRQWLWDVPPPSRTELCKDILRDFVRTNSTTGCKSASESDSARSSMASSRSDADSARSQSPGRYSQCPCASCWGNRHCPELNHRQSESNLPELDSCQTDTNPPEPDHRQSSSDEHEVLAKLDLPVPSLSANWHSRQSTRVMAKNSKWKATYYIRNGQRRKIIPEFA